jgi:hypothetical protein
MRYSTASFYRLESRSESLGSLAGGRVFTGTRRSLLLAERIVASGTCHRGGTMNQYDTEYRRQICRERTAELARDARRLPREDFEESRGPRALGILVALMRRPLARSVAQRTAISAGRR